MNLKHFVNYFALLALVFVLPVSVEAEENQQPVKEVIRVSIADGKIQGQVFTMFEDQKAPLVGKVSLTDPEGNTVSTSDTDDTGNFAFIDVEPGNYRAVGVAGDYVGDTEIVVTLAEENDEDSEGVYTAIPLAVAPAPSSAIYTSYASMPAASFSTAPSFSHGGGGCVTCGGGGGGIRSTCGGGGGLNFRRLALIGAIAIPIALSGGNDDMATPDE